MSVAGGEEGECAGGAGVDCLVRDAGGDEEDVAGAGGEEDADGFFFVSVFRWLCAFASVVVAVVCGGG